jgi:hypothetical protein
MMCPARVDETVIKYPVEARTFRHHFRLGASFRQSGWEKKKRPKEGDKGERERRSELTYGPPCRSR